MKLKTFIIMGLLSMFGLGSCNAQQKDNIAKGNCNDQQKDSIVHKELHYTMDENAPKNYYQIAISVYRCGYRVFVNDIPVTNVRDVIYPFESIEALFPINEYIHRSGTQKLKVEFYPREGYEENGSENEKSIYLKHLEVRKYIYSDDNHYDTIHINPVPKIKKGTTPYVYETDFHAEVPHDIPILDECVRLDTIPNIGKLVQEKYNELKTMCEKGKYSQFIDEFFIPGKIYSIINYYPDDTDSYNEQQREHSAAFMREEYKEKVGPIKNYEMQFYGKGKLVTLINKTDSLATFRLYTRSDYCETFEFYLGMRKGSDKLEIIYK